MEQLRAKSLLLGPARHWTGEALRPPWTAGLLSWQIKRILLSGKSGGDYLPQVGGSTPLHRTNAGGVGFGVRSAAVNCTRSSRGNWSLGSRSGGEGNSRQQRLIKTACVERIPMARAAPHERSKLAPWA